MSCLACQAAKAKCGASPVRKQPRKEVRKGSPGSEVEDGVYLWEMERVASKLEERMRWLEGRMKAFEERVEKKLDYQLRILQEVRDYIAWGSYSHQEFEPEEGSESDSGMESDDQQEIVEELAELREELTEVGKGKEKEKEKEKERE